MGFQSKLREYEIDLSAEPEARWAQVIDHERETAQQLFDEGFAQFAGLFRKGALSQERLEEALVPLHRGHYLREINAWAAGLGRSSAEGVLFNSLYELSHWRDFFGGLWQQVMLGCTAGARWVKGLGMVHLRNLDWPLPSVGAATRLFRFRDGRRQFVTIGFPGFVGALSGMLPRRYSVTLNWAPHQGDPQLDFGAAFLVRRVLEECDSYQEAVRMLAHIKIAAPVFYLVCGVKKGEACVIERQPAGGAIRRPTEPVIVQANHHVAPGYIKQNNILRMSPAGAAIVDDSIQRAATLQRSLMLMESAQSLDDVAFACLDEEPVCNDDTYQQMAFCPKTGELRAWRWVD